MKPRILHLVALDTIGGVEQLYSFYIKASSDQFTHLTLNDRRHISPVLLPTIERYSESIGSTKRWYCLPVPKTLRNAHLSRCFKKLNPDLVVVWNKVAGFDRKLLSSRIPVIYYEHGGGRASPQPELAKKFLESVDSIVCASEASKALITRKWHLKRDDLLVCHNAIRPECFPEDNQVPVKKLCCHSEVVLGMAGRLISNKGLPIALHSLKLLLEEGYKVRLKIAGQGPEQSNFTELAHVLGVSGNVDFLGNVSDMALFYRSLDIFLCPSLSESFGLVAVEAGAWGVPVIASDVGGLSEVVEHGSTGMLIKPGLTTEEYQQLGARPDRALQETLRESSGSEPLVAVAPPKMAAEVAMLIKDSGLYLSLSSCSRRKNCSDFSPGSYVDKLSAIFKSRLKVNSLKAHY